MTHPIFFPFFFQFDLFQVANYFYFPFSKPMPAKTAIDKQVRKPEQ